MQPTLRAVLLVGASFAVAMLAVIADVRLWPLWVAYLGAALLLIGLDALLALPRRRLGVRASAPAQVYVGEREPVTVTLAAPRWRWPTSADVLVELDDDLAVVDEQRVTVPGRGAIEVPFELRPRRRGTHRIHAVWTRWTGPFGLTRRQSRTALDSAVVVVPNVRAARQAALRIFSRDAFFGQKAENYVGDGTSFESLREHVPGMDHRAIDWKHSARHRRLVSKEFRAERNHQIVLAFDTGHLMSEPLGAMPRIDHAISAGLLLGYVSLRGGDRVGVFGFDSRVRVHAEPVAGVASFPRLQRSAAELDYSAGETNYTLGLAELATRLKRRSLVVILTDFVDTTTAEMMIENVHRLANRHLVVFVSLRDPTLSEIAGAAPTRLTDMYRSVVAGDFLRERELVLGRLRRMGVHCIDATPAQLSVDLVNRYLEIKRRELI